MYLRAEIKSEAVQGVSCKTRAQSCASARDRERRSGLTASAIADTQALCIGHGRAIVAYMSSLPLLSNMAILPQRALWGRLWV